MIRFNTKIAAGVVVSLSVVYAALSIATGHQARSVMPPDLRATDAGVDVWKTVALLAKHPGKVAVLDVRAKEAFARYHLPRSQSLPGGDAKDLVDHAVGHTHAVVVASSDAEAAKLVGTVRKLKSPATFHFLKGGAQAAYLALELPVPLFNDKPPPHGYPEAVDRVRTWLSKPSPKSAPAVVQAVEKIVSTDYQPTALQAKKKPKADGKKKKIAGGCG